jgi:uncharacterized protein (TIGR02118 family)
MIKVSVLYPSGDGINFDRDYFVHRHIPMVNDALGPALRGISVDAGISGGSADVPPPFVCSVHLLFDSVDSFESAAGALTEQLGADLPNYTNAAPTVQVSDILPLTGPPEAS